MKLTSSGGWDVVDSPAFGRPCCKAGGFPDEGTFIPDTEPLLSMLIIIKMEGCAAAWGGVGYFPVQTRGLPNADSNTNQISVLSAC